VTDPLTRAARALRETNDGTSPDAASTRSRILGASVLRKKRRRVFVAVWMPLAAVLVVSSAWAAVTGRLPRLAAWLRGAPHAPAMGAPRPRPPLDPSESPTPTAPPVPPPARESPRASAPPASTPTAPPASSPPAFSGTSATAPRPRRDRDRDHDREEGLYTAAHHAHFVDRDPAAALTAWDAYLAAYPDGRFAPEARYNRALTLVRLGRIDEARAALEPFADGRTHGYRQTEARTLLDALDASDGGR
jgi:hypothetical protein